jgi:hypothetical protein
MATTDPSTYAWMNEDLAWFGVAACVTVATGASRAELAEAFGADLASPPSAFGIGRLVSFREISGCQVAIEVDGYQGIEPEVLAAASVRGRAASAFWNVNGLVKFGCAQDGQVLYIDDFAFDDDRRGLPGGLVPLVDLVSVDLDDEDEVDETERPLRNTVALAMVETFTGARVTPADAREALREGYALRDQG